MEAVHPPLEPAVVGIDVLNVESALDDSLAAPDVDRSMSDAGRSSDGGIGTGAVGTEDRVAVDQRAQLLGDMGSIQYQ